jgi:hypothetical protein
VTVAPVRAIAFFSLALTSLVSSTRNAWNFSFESNRTGSRCRMISPPAPAPACTGYQQSPPVCASGAASGLPRILGFRLREERAEIGLCGGGGRVSDRQSSAAADLPLQSAAPAGLLEAPTEPGEGFLGR